MPRVRNRTNQWGVAVAYEWSAALAGCGESADCCGAADAGAYGK